MSEIVLPEVQATDIKMLTQNKRQGRHSCWSSNLGCKG